MKINGFGKGGESTLSLARVVGVSSSEGLVEGPLMGGGGGPDFKCRF